ncbi:MAG: TolC family protein [Pseudomonadota bacterium]
MFYKFKSLASTLCLTTLLTFTCTQLTAGEDNLLSFDEVINQALNYSLSIKGQEQAVKASTSNVYSAYGNWLPHVNASTGNTNVRQRYKTPNVNRVNDDYHYQNNQLTINQSIFNGGKNFASLQHARAGENSAKARYTSTINQALLEAVDMYIKLYNALATGKITQNRVDLLKKHKTATETKLKLGSSTKTELAETLAELASAEADHASTKSDIERYRAEYLRLTNNTPPAALAKPQYCDNLPASLAFAIETGLKINPDIAQAGNQYKQAKANVHSARGDILPKVTFDYNISKPRYNDRLNFNIFFNFILFFIIKLGFSDLRPISIFTNIYSTPLAQASNYC